MNALPTRTADAERQLYGAPQHERPGHPPEDLYGEPQHETDPESPFATVEIRAVDAGATSGDEHRLHPDAERTRVSPVDG